MATVSEQLRCARESQKLDIHQVAEFTKIKTDHLRALESGDYDLFSAPVYIRGSIRTYATMLKLDVARLLADLEVELARTERFAEPPPLTKQPRGDLDWVMLQLSRLNWRIALALVALAVVLVVGVAFLRARSAARSDPLKKLGPGLYQPSRPDQAGETLPLPGSTPRR